MHQTSLLTMCFCDGHPNTRLFGNHTPCRSIKDKPKFSCISLKLLTQTCSQKMNNKCKQKWYYKYTGNMSLATGSGQGSGVAEHLTSTPVDSICSFRCPHLVHHVKCNVSAKDQKGKQFYEAHSIGNA
jgi:hypothetical protein